MTSAPNISAGEPTRFGESPTDPPIHAKIDLKQARLRANPAFELVLLDQLSAAEGESLRGLAEDPDCYGVLRPRENSALSIKAVSRDAALLLFSLQQPGALPRYAARSMGEDCAATIGKMVLDGILEVEANGRMISGPEASDLVCGAAHSSSGEGVLAGMSRRAVEYAASLGLSEPRELSARLYTYNCIPASARWRRLLPADSETGSYLGLVKRQDKGLNGGLNGGLDGGLDGGMNDGVHGELDGGTVARALSGKWQLLAESVYWIHWQPTASRQEDARPGQPVTNYKLYVSPACDRLRETIAALADAVARSNAIHWKVGRGLRGFLRPDKLVIYFRQFAELQEVALKIMKQLEGCTPHGVPFTAELAGTGLLSWGIDPPDRPNDERNGEPTGAWRERESWRSRLSNRLALALAQAGREQAGELKNPSNAARFALQRVRLEGIDTSTWTPSPAFAWRA